MYREILVPYLACRSLHNVSPVFVEVNRMEESSLMENKIRTTGQLVNHGLHPVELPPQGLRLPAISCLLGKLVPTPQAQERDWPITVYGNSCWYTQMG